MTGLLRQIVQKEQMLAVLALQGNDLKITKATMLVNLQSIAQAPPDMRSTPDYEKHEAKGVGLRSATNIIKAMTTEGWGENIGGGFDLLLFEIGT